MSTFRKEQRAARKPSNQPLAAGLGGPTTSLEAERDLLIGILETLSQSRHMDEYLEQLVTHLSKYSGCHYVGIRLLEDNGNVPYVSYTGFSREFYESESPLCIKSDKCMCINVIKGNTKPGLSFYTDGGSFLSNGTTELLTSVPKEVIGENRGVCNQYGFETVALVPMRHKGRILGLIHLADESGNKVPVGKVRFLERVGAYLGEALHVFIAEEALQESEKRYRSLYEEAPIAYFSVGIDGSIERANNSAAELFGYGHDRLIGQPVLDLYADTPNGKAKAQEVFQRFLAGEEIRGEELEMCRADGSKVWISLSVWPIRDKEGRVMASRSAAVDITERKKLDQLKDEFIGLVSHELRSPLTVIIGAVNTALSEEARLSRDEMRQLLQDAAWEADSLSHLLGNLLELSRAQAERLFLYTEPVIIQNVVQETVNRIRRQSAAHKFFIDFREGLSPIPADQLRLERILYNLLENAIKYSPKGGEIRVFAKLEKEYLVIGVSDQGVGISVSDQARLFRPFQRLETPGFDSVKGAGLGLLVCRRLVEAHGGWIWVESEPDVGSTFFFTLPLRNALSEQGSSENTKRSPYSEEAG